MSLSVPIILTIVQLSSFLKRSRNVHFECIPFHSTKMSLILLQSSYKNKWRPNKGGWVWLLLVSELLWWCWLWAGGSKGFKLWTGYASIASFCRKASSLRRLANQLYTRTSVTRLEPRPWALEGDTPLCTHSALRKKTHPIQIKL